MTVGYSVHQRHDNIRSGDSPFTVSWAPPTQIERPGKVTPAGHLAV